MIVDEPRVEIKTNICAVCVKPTLVSTVLITVTLTITRVL